MQKTLGQPLVIENVAGVGGALGAQKALAAPPDGHTIFFGTPMELVQTPLAVASAKYKPADFRMLGLGGSTYMMMIVRADLPANSVGEFVSMAKQTGQREVSYGSVGRGTAYHLVAERFAQETGTKLLHVPYKGAQQLITDLASGQIDMAFLAMGGPVPGLLRLRKFKAIGFTGPARHPDFPSVATMNESKVVKDFQFDLWGAFMVNKNVPAALAERLSAAVQSAVRDSQVRGALQAAGIQPVEPMTLTQASQFYNAEIARYGAIAKASNLQPE